MKDRLRKIRIENNMTQQEMADMLSIKRNTWGQYEIGRNEPMDAVIELICEKFGVDKNWLVTGEGEPYSIATDKEGIGGRIKYLRKNLGLTQDTFSGQLGLNRANIANYEVGNSSPAKATITLICKTFSVNRRWLLSGQGEMYMAKENQNTETDVSDRIRKIRNEHGLTQKEFAARIGIKGNTIAQYELGRNIPTGSIIELICREYDINRNWLLYGEGEMHNPKYEVKGTSKKNINRLISYLLELADAIDENIDIWTDASRIMGIELGGKAFADYIRAGIKDVISLQGDYQKEKERTSLAKIGEEEAEKVLTDIFGDSDVTNIPEEWKVKFRSLYAKLVMQENQED